MKNHSISPDTAGKGPNWIYNLLNIKEGEGRSVGMLILFSFFIGLATTFYFTASNAIFIRHFEPRMISLSFMVSGVAVYLTWLLLTLIDRRLPVRARFIVKFLLVLLCVIAISIGTWLSDSGVMAFILFTFVRVLVYISLVTFWGLAGKLFNLRQGKRIFGLIGAGEVISIIIGYFSVPIVLKFVETPSLLFISSFALLVCFIMVLIITRVYQEQIQSTEGTSPAGKKSISGQWRYTRLIRKPYFSLISVMALLPIFGYLFVDYMFLKQTKIEFQNDRETIAQFFGYVLGFVAIVELIFKLFVSGRLLNKYGLKPSLLMLPLALLTSTVMAAIFGTFYGPAGIFFAFIVFSRLIERSTRGAIYEPAFQLLYQPVPPEQRLAFQSQIEGIPKAFGTILTGGILMLFSLVPLINLVHYNYFFLLVIGFWIFLALRMYKSYRGRIQEILTTQKEEMPVTHLTPAEKSADYIKQVIVQSESTGFKRLFPLIEDIEPVKSDQLLGELLRAAPLKVKSEIIKMVEQKQIISAKPVLSEIAGSKEYKDLNTLIDAAMTEIKLAEAYPIDLLSNLARSKDPDEREVAARLLAHSPRYQTIRILSDLLHDPHPVVRKTALVTSGKVKRVELWPGIVDNLQYPEFGYTAFSAICPIGEPITDELEHLFNKSGVSKKTQVLIIRLYKMFASEASIRNLRSKIHFPDLDIRLEVLLALSALNYHADHQEMILIKQTIEKNIGIMVWIMASIQDISQDVRASYLTNALQVELTEKKEMIFLLLSLIYDAHIIRLVRENIESGKNESKIFALEVSDMTVSAEIKEVLLPLFDDISNQERLALLRYRFPQQALGILERLNDIINKDYNEIRTWTKACAIELLIHFDKEEVMGILRANLVNPSRMISETAGWVLHALDPEQYFEILSLQKTENKLRLEPVTRKLGMERSFRERLLIAEKTESLKAHPMFRSIPIYLLADIAHLSQDVRLDRSQPLKSDSDGFSAMGLVLFGQMQEISGKKTGKSFRKGDFIMLEKDLLPAKDTYYIAAEDSLILLINMESIRDLIREYPDFTKAFLDWFAIR